MGSNMLQVPKRFSLRSMLAVLTVLLALIGYGSNTVRGYLAERELLRKILATDKFDPVYSDGTLVPGFGINPVG